MRPAAKLYLTLIKDLLELGVDLARIALGRSQRLVHRPLDSPGGPGVEVYVQRYIDAMGKKQKKYFHFKESSRG